MAKAEFVLEGDVGEIVIEGAAGGALVGGCDDGVTDTVADGVALRVGGRVDRDTRGVGDTGKPGVATAPGEGPLVIGSPTGCDVVMTAIPTPSTSATTTAKIAMIGEIDGRTSFSSSIASKTSSTLGSTAWARADTRSSMASRASSGIASTGRPATNRRAFASRSTTSSHAGHAPRCRRSGTLR